VERSKVQEGQMSWWVDHNCCIATNVVWVHLAIVLYIRQVLYCHITFIVERKEREKPQLKINPEFMSGFENNPSFKKWRQSVTELLSRGMKGIETKAA
jgi:hypothetical protein